MAKSSYYANKYLPPLHEIVTEVFTPEILEEPGRKPSKAPAPPPPPPPRGVWRVRRG
jgi:hypothetical protein